MENNIENEDVMISMTNMTGEINLNNSVDELLNKLMHQTFQINIRGRKVNFDIRDQIFQLSEPV